MFLADATAIKVSQMLFSKDTIILSAGSHLIPGSVPETC
jgi:hypothetical protein